MSPGFPHLMLCLRVCGWTTLFKDPAPCLFISVCIMQGLAAGAESLLSKGQAAVAVTVEEEVVRRGRRSTAGCRRCSWCEAVLATLLALAVAGAVALGYMWFTRVRNDSFATSESESGEGLPTPHCCFSLQQDTNCDDASNRCRPLKCKKLTPPHLRLRLQSFDALPFH